MPLIQKFDNSSEKFKAKISKNIFEEVKSYCEHFGVSLNEFTEQGFKYILEQDKDWKSVKRL